MIAPERALAAIGQLADTEIGIGDAALQLGRALRPELDAGAAAAHLSVLAREAAAIGVVLGPRALEARVGALAALIHARHRYVGDRRTYDDLDNANLMRVIERRAGLPVALGILWLHCIHAAGWHGRGIDFPGHFLLQLDSGDGAASPAGRRVARRDQQILIDVFAAGETVGIGDLVSLVRRHGGADAELTPGLIRPMSTREVLLRLQRNLLERSRASGDDAAALAAVETMVAIAPDRPALWRDAAGLNLSLSRVREAISCLERFVALSPDGGEAREARARISSLRAGLA